MKYRAPRSKNGRISLRSGRWRWVVEVFGESRKRTFVHEQDGVSYQSTTADMSISGGATLDNEENYLIKKAFFTEAWARSCVQPGPYMTQQHGARSGHLLRPGRSYDRTQISLTQMHSDRRFLDGRAHPVGFRWVYESEGAGRHDLTSHHGSRARVRLPTSGCRSGRTALSFSVDSSTLDRDGNCSSASTSFTTPMRPAF